MAVTLTAEQESTVRQGHADGLSQNAVSKLAGVDQPVLSRWSKRNGIIWTRRIMDGAHERRREMIAEARHQLAADLIADAIHIRERLWDEYVLHISTANGVEDITLELPDAKAVSDLTAAIAKLVASSENLDRMGAGRNAEHAKSMLTALRQSLAEATAEPVNLTKAET